MPTGNFGDILAGYFAKEMGLPVGKLVCASNANNVLTDFLRTGRYDRRRPFYKTVSPSMDILVSSNLERLLYLLSGDDKLIADLMKQLGENGEYEVPADMLEKLHELFWAGFCDDEGAKTAIGKVWKDDHYLCDTHTAVAWDVAQQYKQANPEHNAVVVLSTASPYKFPAAVLEGIGEKARGRRVRRDGAAPQGHGRARAEESCRPTLPRGASPRRDRPRRDARLRARQGRGGKVIKENKHVYYLP